jgi:hypothetical protein
MNTPYVKRATYAKLANELDSYMQFRANEEGVGYDLSPDFYAEILYAGVRMFCGCECGDKTILCDHQSPKTFLDWKQSL